MNTDEVHNKAIDTNPFHPSLVNQMLQSNRPIAKNEGATDTDFRDIYTEPKKITNEALVGAGELIRLFAIEAWHRASIEAECEYEGGVDALDQTKNDSVGTGSNVGTTNNGAATIANIRADHITKIAAEILMDFS